MEVTIKIPIIENNQQDYTDIELCEWETRKTFVEPEFTSYYQVLSIFGQSSEDTLPLTVHLLTNEHLPKNSRIVIEEINSAHELDAREWRVLSTEEKQIGNTIYSRIAYCVPARQSSFTTSEVYIQSKFDMELGEPIISFDSENRVYMNQLFKLSASHYDGYLPGPNVSIQSNFKMKLQSPGITF
jgi:hypothetical protein